MLSKLQMLKEEREQGFTLIELLVVILIIGILSAIAIPAFMNQRKSAVDASVQSDVSNAAKQVETWVVKQGSTAKAIPDGLTVTNSTATASAGAAGATALALPINKELTTFKTSDGTTLKIAGNSFGYTITGENSGGDKAKVTAAIPDPDGAGPGVATPASGGVTYSSTLGGLNK